jgi:hypothetical protein
MIGTMPMGHYRVENKNKNGFFSFLLYVVSVDELKMNCSIFASLLLKK